MAGFRDNLGNVWSDADRRRALLLSLVAHLCILLLFVLWLSRPKPVPLEQYIVLNVGTPMQSEEVVRATTVDDPAPTTPTPQVADEETGEPQARTAELPENTAPEQQPRTEQPTPQPRAQPEQPQAAEPAAPEADQRQSRPEPDPVESNEVAPVAPAPQPRTPAVAESAPQLPVETNATVLPEISEVQVQPRPARQVVSIPQPQSTVRVPEAVNVAVNPTVQVAVPQAVPTPQVESQVAEARPVPQPTVQPQVAAAIPIPQPEVASSIPAPTAVPQPNVAATVTAAREVPLPSTAVEVAAVRDVPLPGLEADVSPARNVEVEATAVVSRPVAVPRPLVAAEVQAPTTETGAVLAGAAPAGTAANPSNRVDERIQGGNADRTGQDRPDENAQAGNPGRAADLEGEASGAELLRPRIPYREERERPLAVLLDNANGYPQAGLLEASLIAEMPVEGGITRLMTMYDRRDPVEVGPIRSARDYFVELARGYNGVLVHDGGSPAALAAIDRGTLPTLNAFRFGELFSRQQGRVAPYNLYSSGPSLRTAVNNLRLERSVELQGVVPRPPDDVPEAESVEVRYGGTYRSGFVYLRELDIYRWRRNGENAVDYRGDAVFVEAVLVARIEARPIPDDPAGRLYIPLRGGEATLYLRGRAISGRWLPGSSEGEGVSFVTADGQPFDLAPFRIWMLFAPTYATVASD